MPLQQKISFDQIKLKLQQNIPVVHEFHKNLAAVQILIIENSNLDVVLTKRSVFVQNHKNEISFPGGAFEKGDENLYQTALRETCEEINICERSVQYLGRLEPFKTHYGLEIYPFIGSISAFEFMQATPNWEVEEIFTIPLGWFLNLKNLEKRDMKTVDGIHRSVNIYKAYHDHIVWGITAAIIEDFIQKLTN